MGSSERRTGTDQIWIVESCAGVGGKLVLHCDTPEASSGHLTGNTGVAGVAEVAEKFDRSRILNWRPAEINQHRVLTDPGDGLQAGVIDGGGWTGACTSADLIDVAVVGHGGGKVSGRGQAGGGGPRAQGAVRVDRGIVDGGGGAAGTPADLVDVAVVGHGGG